MPASRETLGDAVGDEALRRATGQDWKAWFAALGAWGAKERVHKVIANHLLEDLGVAPWWSQRITVEYERVRGLRKVGQVEKGYEIGVHRTLPIDAGVAWDLVTRPSNVFRWLGVKDARLSSGMTLSAPDGSVVEVRRIKSPVFLRLRITNPQWRNPIFIQVRIQPRRTGNSISFHEEGLPSQTAREARRRHFRAFLAGLEEKA